MRRPVRLALACAVAALTASVVACAAEPAITFVAQGGVYTLEEAEALVDTVERPEWAGDPVADAPKLRRDALTDLRGLGPTAVELADFVTRVMPADVRSVPYYGSAATIDGVEVWIILEVWGSPGGALDRSRVWVFDRTTGAVIYSSAGM